MADVLVAADESGNFDFSHNTGATRYLILCTVTAGDFVFGNSLLDLRRELAFNGEYLQADGTPRAVRATRGLARGSRWAR